MIQVEEIIIPKGISLEKFSHQREKQKKILVVRSGVD